MPNPVTREARVLFSEGLGVKNVQGHLVAFLFPKTFPPVIPLLTCQRVKTPQRSFFQRAGNQANITVALFPVVSPAATFSHSINPARINMTEGSGGEMAKNGGREKGEMGIMRKGSGG